MIKERVLSQTEIVSLIEKVVDKRVKEIEGKLNQIILENENAKKAFENSMGFTKGIFEKIRRRRE